MKQLVIFCSVLLVVIIACIFCLEFRHHYPNHLRLLTSASVCSIPCMFYHVKVFLHQQLGFHFVENFVIIVTFIILIPRHVKAFVLVTFSTCSPSYVFFFLLNICVCFVQNFSIIFINNEIGFSTEEFVLRYLSLLFSSAK